MFVKIQNGNNFELQIHKIMKKYSILIFFTLVTGTLFGQGADKDVYVNIKGGLNFSGLSDEPEGVSTNNKIGYNAGLDLRLGSGIIFLQPGAFYYEYNQEFSVNANTPSASTQEIKVQSIKIPVQLGLRPLTTDILAIRINAGPAFNFPVNVSRESGNLTINRDDYKSASVGGVVGAGIDLSVFTFDVNYEFGLSDYVDFSNSNFTSGTSKQYVLSLNFGIRF